MEKADIFKRDNQARFIDLALKGSLPGKGGKNLPKVPSDDPLCRYLPNFSVREESYHIRTDRYPNPSP